MQDNTILSALSYFLYITLLLDWKVCFRVYACIDILCIKLFAKLYFGRCC